MVKPCNENYTFLSFAKPLVPVKKADPSKVYTKLKKFHD